MPSKICLFRKEKNNGSPLEDSEAVLAGRWIATSLRSCKRWRLLSPQRWKELGKGDRKGPHQVVKKIKKYHLRKGRHTTNQIKKTHALTKLCLYLKSIRMKQNKNEREQDLTHCLNLSQISTKQIQSFCRFIATVWTLVSSAQKNLVIAVIFFDLDISQGEVIQGE